MSANTPSFIAQPPPTAKSAIMTLQIPPLNLPTVIPQPVIPAQPLFLTDTQAAPWITVQRPQLSANTPPFIAQPPPTVKSAIMTAQLATLNLPTAGPRIVPLRQAATAQLFFLTETPAVLWITVQRPQLSANTPPFIAQPPPTVKSAIMTPQLATLNLPTAGPKTVQQSREAMVQPPPLTMAMNISGPGFI